MLLVAAATSLPEASTTLGAVRLGLYGMAFYKIFGANILDVSIGFLADAVFPGGPVLAEVGRFSLLGALLGILVTTVYWSVCWRGGSGSRWSRRARRGAAAARAAARREACG